MTEPFGGVCGGFDGANDGINVAVTTVFAPLTSVVVYRYMVGPT